MIRIKYSLSEPSTDLTKNIFSKNHKIFVNKIFRMFFYTLINLLIKNYIKALSSILFICLPKKKRDFMAEIKNLMNLCIIITVL